MPKAEADLRSVTIRARITPALALELDAACAELSMTRSEYVRLLLSLPIRFEFVANLDSIQPYSIDDINSAQNKLLRFLPSTGGNIIFVMPPSRAESSDITERKTSGGATETARNERCTLLFSDLDLYRLIISIDRIGTNYNQSVHALNTLARRFGRRDDAIDEDDLVYIRYQIEGVRDSNREVKRSLDVLSDIANEFIDAQSIHIPASAKRRRKAAK